MGISKITRNFQITLPRDVREFKNLNVGDKVLFVVEDKRIELVKLDKNIVKDTAGIWSGMKESGVEYERRLRKGWKKRPKL
jgi:AbrB family looped-hinge helix DNA binding protein